MQNQNTELKKLYCLEVAKRLAKYPQYDHKFNYTECYLIQLRVNWNGKGRKFPKGTIGIVNINHPESAHILIERDILDVYPIGLYTTQYDILA